jgi:hypothetical protein
VNRAAIDLAEDLVRVDAWLRQFVGCDTPDLGHIGTVFRIGEIARREAGLSRSSANSGRVEEKLIRWNGHRLTLLGQSLPRLKGNSYRKVIERAKGILMKRAGLVEANAFRRLQKLASDKNVKLVRLAEMIGTAQEAMQ